MPNDHPTGEHPAAGGPGWSGQERRRTPTVDDTRLDTALEEIRRLHGAATELATVVARTVPREEVEAREKQFRLQLIALAAAIVFLLGFTLLFLMPKLLDRFDRLDEGQRIQQCLAAKTEAERTGPLADTAVLTCSQKVMR